MAIVNNRATSAEMALLFTVLMASWWHISAKSSVNLLNDIKNILGKETCKEKPHDCSSDARCISKFEKYICICKAGFIGDGHVCKDRDECKESRKCHSNAKCENTVGSFTCKCNVGYSGDGFECNDIDECRNPSACHPKATCKNTRGSFTCNCKDGFTADGLNCTDINECGKSNPCDSNAVCTNTAGSFTCKCKPNFVGNGMTCNAKPSSPNIQVVVDAKTHDDAKANCLQQSGALAIITTSELAEKVFKDTERGKIYHVGYKIDVNGNVIYEDGNPAQKRAGIGFPLPVTITAAFRGICATLYRSSNEMLIQPTVCTKKIPSICAI